MMPLAEYFLTGEKAEMINHPSIYNVYNEISTINEAPGMYVN